MKVSVRAFVKDESGATAMEYSLLAGVLVIAIIASVRAIGANISTIFPKVSGNLA